MERFVYNSETLWVAGTRELLPVRMEYIASMATIYPTDNTDALLPKNECRLLIKTNNWLRQQGNKNNSVEDKKDPGNFVMGLVSNRSHFGRILNLHFVNLTIYPVVTVGLHHEDRYRDQISTKYILHGQGHLQKSGMGMWMCMKGTENWVTWSGPLTSPTSSHGNNRKLVRKNLQFRMSSM